MVFYIWSAVFIFGAVFFAIFARGEVQEWAKGENQDSTDDSESDGEMDNTKP